MRSRVLTLPSGGSTAVDVTAKSLATMMRTIFALQRLGSARPMLVIVIGFLLEGKRFAVQFGLLHCRAQTDGRTKFDG